MMNDVKYAVIEVVLEVINDEFECNVMGLNVFQCLSMRPNVMIEPIKQ